MTTAYSVGLKSNRMSNSNILAVSDKYRKWWIVSESFKTSFMSQWECVIDKKKPLTKLTISHCINALYMAKWKICSSDRNFTWSWILGRKKKLEKMKCSIRCVTTKSRSKEYESEPKLLSRVCRYLQSARCNLVWFVEVLRCCDSIHTGIPYCSWHQPDQWDAFSSAHPNAICSDVCFEIYILTRNIGSLNIQLLHAHIIVGLKCWLFAFTVHPCFANGDIHFNRTNFSFATLDQRVTNSIRL